MFKYFADTASSYYLSSLLNDFDKSTKVPWQTMSDKIISPLKKNINKDVLNIKDNPLTEYSDYKQDIIDNKIGKIDWLLLTSGTDGKSKLIPIYESNESSLLSQLIVDKYYPKGDTLMVYHVSETILKDNINISNSITRVFNNLFNSWTSSSYMKASSVSPQKVFMIKDPYLSYYEHIKHALLKPKMTRMILYFNRHLLLLIRIMIDRTNELIEDIKKIDPTRATEIKVEFAEGFDNIIPRLWPKLKVIVAGCSGNFKLYNKRLEKYIGTIPIFSPLYAATESYFGYNIENDGYYVLDPNVAYFEFIDQESKKCVSLTNVKIGDLYELVISTTQCRLIRYKTEDIIKVVGKYNNTPKIDFVCKKNDLLINMLNNIIVPSDIENVLSQSVELIDYCYRIPKSESIDSITNSVNNKVKLYIEIEDRKCDQELDKKLSDKLNIKFDVRILNKGTIDKLYQRRYSDHLDPGQIKIPRCITNDEDIKIVKENVFYRLSL